MAIDNSEQFNEKRPISFKEGIRLSWPQLGHLTLRQLEPIVAEGSEETTEGFLWLLAPLAQIASSETAQAYSLLAEQIRDYEEGQRPAPSWTPLLASFKREPTRVAITDETSLRTISEMLWQMHTAQ